MPDYSVQRFRGGFALVWKSSDGKRHRRQLGASDRPGAEAEARRIWESSGSHQWAVGRIMIAYMADRAADGIATANRQQDAWKAMRPFWDRTDPALIDKQMARDYAATRKVGPATLRYELSMLAVGLRWAKAKGYISHTPEIWRPAAPEPKVKHLTHAQFEKFFAAVAAPHARLYVLLGLYTMARPSAILELTWDRVDLERGMINLNAEARSQTKKRRPVVPIHPEALEALKLAYEARQCEYVVERGAKRIDSIKKAFQAASARSGVHATPYSLRHTGAVWAVEAGASMDEIAQAMGHDNSSTTSKHYARFSPDYLRGVIGRVQRKVQ